MLTACPHLFLTNNLHFVLTFVRDKVGAVVACTNSLHFVGLTVRCFMLETGRPVDLCAPQPNAPAKADCVCG